MIGVSEAQSIAISLEGIVPPRPITHDLFVSFSHGFGIRLKEVCIYKFENGVFSSEMLFDDGMREIRIDARTSDAIAIALRTRSDIYVMQDIIDEAGFVYEENEGKEVVETEELPEERVCRIVPVRNSKNAWKRLLLPRLMKKPLVFKMKMNKRDNNL